MNRLKQNVRATYELLMMKGRYNEEKKDSFYKIKN